MLSFDVLVCCFFLLVNERKAVSLAIDRFRDVGHFLYCLLLLAAVADVDAVDVDVALLL